MRARAVVAASFAFFFASGLLGVSGCGDADPADPPAASGGAGGGGSAGGGAGSVGTPDTSGVVYVAGATDEALESVVGVAASVDDAKAPILAVPGSDGEVFTQLSAPTFAWSAAVALREPAPLRKWVEFVSPRQAFAHGDPNTGLVYYAEFSDAKGAPLLRVFTTKTTYTPDAAQWAKLVTAGGQLSLRVIGARVENNKLVPGGGPFVASSARTFSIAP